MALPVQAPYVTWEALKDIQDRLSKLEQKLMPRDRIASEMYDRISKLEGIVIDLQEPGHPFTDNGEGQCARCTEPNSSVGTFTVSKDTTLRFKEGNRVTVEGSNYPLVEQVQPRPSGHSGSEGTKITPEQLQKIILGDKFGFECYDQEHWGKLASRINAHFNGEGK